MADATKHVEIEAAIAEKLTGDARRNALDFVAFLRANNLALGSGGDGEGWAVGGAVGNSVGYMLVNGAAEIPGPWTIWLNTCDFGGDPPDEGLKEAAWAHASPCGKCHPGWKDCGGGDRVIWGKAFERLCHSPLMFANPDANELAHVEALVLRLN